jgi:hypothetical protein
LSTPSKDGKMEILLPADVQREAFSTFMQILYLFFVDIDG